MEQRGLTDRDALLRRAFAAAFSVARAGEESDPVVPAPLGLRPFLHFTRLPRTAHAPARRALESDDEFRARVAEATTEADVGRAAWLFLTRPLGWEEELAMLERSAREAEEAVTADREERDFRKAVQRLEIAIRRAEEDARRARSDEAAAEAALGEERRARQRASERAAELERRLAAAAAELEAANTAVARSRAEITRLRERVDRLQEEVATLEADATAARAARSDLAVATLREAAQSATTLADGLVSAAQALAGGEVEEAPGGQRRGQSTGTAARGRRPPDPMPAQSSTEPAKRRPAPLPPAVLDDSPDAADYLLRRPRVVLLVDGYNVSQGGWPDLPIAEQRKRLADALAELAARTGADVHVVFDGSDIPVPPPVATVSKAVKTMFSPPGTEADDVVVAAVAGVPLGRPVVVASSDRQVAAGSRRQGANVISARQLLAVMRR